MDRVRVGVSFLCKKAESATAPDASHPLVFGKIGGRVLSRNDTERKKEADVRRGKEYNQDPVTLSMKPGLNRSPIPVSTLRDPSRGIYGRGRAGEGAGLFSSLELNEKHRQ